MNFSESIRLSFENIKTNKLRSFLTMLGIIIGISAVITITTIGTSLKKTIASTMRELGGANLIYCYADVIYPEDMTEEQWDTWEYPQMTDKEKLTYDKIIKLKEDFAGRIDAVMVAEDISYSASSTGTAKDSSVNVYVSGITPGYLAASKVDISSGRDISDADNRNVKATAVVSDLYVKYACDGENPVGKEISIKAEDGTIQKFYVVGVYHFDKTKNGIDATTKEKDITTYIYVPYTYAHETNKANGMENDTTNFNIMATDGTDTESLISDLIAYFDTNYYAENSNFELTAYDMASELSSIDQVLNVLTVAISVIAGISLIVGGVGVMNIMLVSVVERTREIGIRKALGAKNKSIRRQFLMEAVVICFVGGIIGILIGVLNGFLLAQVAGAIVRNYESSLGAMVTISVSPSITAIIISVTFSMLIGIIFGYYPAKRAANLSPIDALRYE